MKYRSPLGVWILIGITFGIYGAYLYHVINRDLARHLGEKQTATYTWWSQIVPFWGVVGLHKTAQRINDAAAMRRGKLISPTATWLWWSWFFVGSWTYLQVGVNRTGV